MSASPPPSASPALPVQSILGDTSDWDQSVVPDVDLEDDTVGLASDSASAVTASSSSAATASASSTRAAPQHQHQSFVKEYIELESLLKQLPYSSTSVPRISSIFDEYQEQCELLDPHLPHTITTLMNYVHAIIRPGKVNPVPPINSTTGAIRLDAAPSAAAATFTPSTPRCNDTELITRVFKIIYTLSKVRGYKTIVHFFPHEVADLEPTLRLLQQQNMNEYETWETRYGLLLWLSIIVLIPFDLNTVDSSMVKGATTATTNTVGIISSLIALGERYMSDTGPPREASAVMLAKLFSRTDMHASHLAAFLKWCINEIARVSSLDKNAETSKSSAASSSSSSSLSSSSASSSSSGVSASSSHVFLITGIFRCLAEIFRHTPRDVLLQHVHTVYEPILHDNTITWTKSSNTLLRKLYIKLAQRVGLTYLPVRVAKWRYQRGHRSLLTTLQQATGVKPSEKEINPILGSNHAAASSSSSAAKSSSSSSSSSKPSDTADEDENDEDVPSEIEDIIQILLDGLRDRDTIVRWSSAKGIGRITNVLPASYGDDVVGAVLELFSGRESDGAWHGGCLALAELARRGLLLPERLKQVVPITVKALTYDQRTSTHSVGAHVRDASCYVQWAFARAYAPEVMAPYMHSLAAGLLTICVFDREINVRRAASAAFQEHVGRQGSHTFAHGMAILQIADYFTVSNRSNSYQLVSYEIAKYEEYTLPLIEHLLQYKVSHWEKELRELTAKTLGLLTKRNAISHRYMRDVVIQSLIVRVMNKANSDINEKHGAILSIAEVLLALHSLDKKEYVSVQLRLEVCTLINTLTASSNSQLLNGRGGQIMRESICRLIEVLARIGLLYTNAQTLAYLRPYQAILDENLGHTNAEVTEAAMKAVEQYVRAYYLPLPGTDDVKATQDKLARAKQAIDHYVRTLGHPSSLPGATRGFASALGVFPRELLTTTQVQAVEVYSAKNNAAGTSTATSASAASAASSSATPAPLPLPSPGALIYQPLSRILQTLITASTECGQSDAETRRNSVQSLVKLIETLTDEDLTQWMTMPPTPPPMPTLTPAATSSSASSAVSAAREKDQKTAQKAIKLQIESLTKYWHRDLHELGIPGNRIHERVATALLICLDDYATDNRGDVGSWVREAAMTGLEVLAVKLARIQAAKPEEKIYPPLLSQRVITSLLKQSVEKIDRVREKSGQIFERLLWNTQVGIPDIPMKNELRERFKKEMMIDWSSPTQTFPLLTGVMSFSHPSSASAADSSSLLTYPYHRALLSGLLISVGGLTESVVKSSSDAFISYVSKLTSSISSNDASAAESLTLLKLLSSDLLYILQLERGHARVIVPAFKTLEGLLSQNLLEPLTMDVCSFATDLQSRVWKEVSKSSNIHKLMASIPVLVGLLPYPPPLRPIVYQNLLVLLGHATFPKIRRLTGESMYNALLISEELIRDDAEENPEAVQEVLDILTQTAWDGPVAQARTERDKLYALLKLEKPVTVVKKTTGKSTASSAASATSPTGDISALGTDYSSLVRNIGY